MANILVTGGAGFIGSHLVEKLIHRGDQVKIVDDFSSGKEKNLTSFGSEVELYRLDIRNTQGLSQAMKGCEVVFHQAAISSVPRSILKPQESTEVNVMGTLSVLEAARMAGVGKVIYASSSSFYGDTEVLPKIETMGERVKSPYAAGKYMGEIYLRLYADLHQMETLSLRYFNVFGPRQDPHSAYAAVIPAFVQNMLSGKKPIIYGDGEQTRDFTFVENVVQANIKTLETRGLKGEVVNIGCGESFSLNQLVKLVGHHLGLLGPKSEPEYQPFREGDVKHSLASIEKAQNLIGYKPSISFEQGIQKTVEWYREDFRN